MSSKIVLNLSGVENENEEYFAGIRITDEDGKEISFDASGETPEELYTNIFLNGITTVLDSKISEDDIIEDDIHCSCNCGCAHCEEESVDTDEMLLDYALMLEEENEQLRDEVQFLRNRLEKADELIVQFPKVYNITEELLAENEKLEKENDSLYNYAFALQNELDKLEKENNTEEDETPTLTTYRYYIDKNGDLIEEIEKEWLLF